MIAVGRISERAGFVDDALAALLGFNDYALDRHETIFHLRMQRQCGFNSSLGMKFRREGDLEQNVLHHIGTESLIRNSKRFASESHILKTPQFRAERAGIPHLTAKRL